MPLSGILKPVDSRLKACGNDRALMKSFLKFLLIFGAILLLSAFLAPVLFQFLPFKFERIFRRLVMIFSIAAAFIFVRIGPETFKGYGLGWKTGSASLLLRGFVLGVCTLALLVSAGIWGGAAVWVPKSFQPGLYAGIFAKALMTGLIVGLIEEFFFRGFVYSWLKSRWRWTVVSSMVSTSIFYSLVHFISKSNPFIGPNPVFRDSLTLIGAPFISLLAWHEIWPHALGLFLFGMVLNFLAIRTGSLYPSIGLHAGCVFFLKSDALFVEFSGKYPFVWAGSAMVDGLVSWIFLLLLFPVSMLLFKEKGQFSSHSDAKK